MINEKKETGLFVALVAAFFVCAWLSRYTYGLAILAWLVAWLVHWRHVCRLEDDDDA